MTTKSSQPKNKEGQFVPKPSASAPEKSSPAANEPSETAHEGEQANGEDKKPELELLKEQLEVSKATHKELIIALEKAEEQIENLKKKTSAKGLKSSFESPDEEMKDMIKMLQAMFDRCRQLERSEIKENGRAPRFVLVVENNLKACLSHIHMFAKDVK